MNIVSWKLSCFHRLKCSDCWVCCVGWRRGENGETSFDVKTEKKNNNNNNNKIFILIYVSFYWCDTNQFIFMLVCKLVVVKLLVAITLSWH